MQRFLLAASAAVIVAVMSGPAFGAGNNMSSIGSNVVESVQGVPGLLSGLSYMFAIILGALGIIKIKDHVENPQQTALKDGAARLLAGGALFALPIVVEAMRNTIGPGGGVETQTLAAVTMGVAGGGGGGRLGGCAWIFC